MPPEDSFFQQVNLNFDKSRPVYPTTRPVYLSRSKSATASVT